MNNIHPFNNKLEYGLRATIILSLSYSREYDLNELSCLDYLVVHSGDFNHELRSIHAPLPNRKSEIFIRRTLLNEGLDLFSKYCLVKPIYKKEGVYYKVTEECEPFLDCLCEDYTSLVKERALWAMNEYGGLDYMSLRNVINKSSEVINSEIAFNNVVGEY